MNRNSTILIATSVYRMYLAQIFIKWEFYLLRGKYGCPGRTRAIKIFFTALFDSDIQNIYFKSNLPSGRRYFLYFRSTWVISLWRRRFLESFFSDTQNFEGILEILTPDSVSASKNTSKNPSQNIRSELFFLWGCVIYKYIVNNSFQFTRVDPIEVLQRKKTQ